jgi:hypothetical protein
MTLEPFVSATEAAKFLGISRRFLLSLARRGIAGSYAIGGDQRHRWVFRLSELGIAIDHRHPRPWPPPIAPPPATPSPNAELRLRREQRRNDGSGYDLGRVAAR